MCMCTYIEFNCGHIIGGLLYIYIYILNCKGEIGQRVLRDDTPFMSISLDNPAIRSNLHEAAVSGRGPFNTSGEDDKQMKHIKDTLNVLFTSYTRELIGDIQELRDAVHNIHAQMDILQGVINDKIKEYNTHLLPPPSSVASS